MLGFEIQINRQKSIIAPAYPTALVSIGYGRNKKIIILLFLDTLTIFSMKPSIAVG